jgi:3-isopropylmalate/(R)-2-methylmalate dehydratase small subunit
VNPYLPFESPFLVLARDHVDTDQIIPARFLKTTTKTGLGRNCFQDWRYDGAGNPIAGFPLNAPGAEAAQVLVVGENFGCGSSREHAPWALLDFGFRAIIARSFADIFRQNALKNGLVPIQVDVDDHRALLEAAAGATVGVDLAGPTLRLPDGQERTFPLDPFRRQCLLQGVDDIGFVLQREPAIAAFETAAIPTFDTRVG